MNRSQGYKAIVAVFAIVLLGGCAGKQVFYPDGNMWIGGYKYDPFGLRVFNDPLPLTPAGMPNCKNVTLNIKSESGKPFAKECVLISP